MEPETSFVVRCRPFLFRVGADQGGVEVDHVRPGIAALPTPPGGPPPGPRRSASGRPRRRLPRCATRSGRGHLTEQVGLIAQHCQIRNGFAAIGNHRCHIDQHLPAGHGLGGVAWSMPSPPTTPPSAQPHRQGPTTAEHRHGPPRPRRLRSPSAVDEWGYASSRKCPSVWDLQASTTRIIPHQKGVFADAALWLCQVGLAPPVLSQVGPTPELGRSVTGPRVCRRWGRLRTDRYWCAWMASRSAGRGRGSTAIRARLPRRATRDEVFLSTGCGRSPRIRSRALDG
jgi:hypothetical protein